MTRAEKIRSVLENEIVTILSFLLAAVSAFFVPPSARYIDYIDFRTLSLLFCLMIIMAGFQTLGLFRMLAYRLLEFAKNTVSLLMTFVLLCFFSAMVITNDVALLTFVPFTMITLSVAGLQSKIIYTVVLETVAANLGSMLTPIGNPQNLYLVSSFNIGIADFVKTIFPYALLSLVLLIAACFFAGKKDVRIQKTREEIKPDKKRLLLYGILFVCALLCVFRVLLYGVLLAVVVGSVLLLDRKVLTKADYSLLFTFVFLFIFIGNLGSIPRVSGFLRRIVGGNEVLTGIAASQVISNVPAAILLSGFTSDIRGLLIGVNLGGLGTLIASMASLISFKLISQKQVSKGKYIFIFTAANLIFLLLNLVLYFVMR